MNLAILMLWVTKVKKENFQNFGNFCTILLNKIYGCVIQYSLHKCTTSCGTWTYLGVTVSKIIYNNYPENWTDWTLCRMINIIFLITLIFMHFINVNNVSNYNGKTVKGQRYNLFFFII